MLDFIIDIIREFLLEIPGAIIRWLSFRGKKPFSEILGDNETTYNYQLSIIFLVVIVLIITFLKTSSS